MSFVAAGEEDDSPRSRHLLTVAIHHLTALVLIMYGLYGTCRFGFGWDPATGDLPPPTYTVHIKGITDDTVNGSTGTLTWNLRGTKRQRE